ncbi:hypothetical protein HDE_00489 [Halotydeus destructor]|nr:hypothetical protein HDE_00489 [Halotydeus destructor]
MELANLVSDALDPIMCYLNHFQQCQLRSSSSKYKCLVDAYFSRVRRVDLSYAMSYVHEKTMLGKMKKIPIDALHLRFCDEAVYVLNKQNVQKALVSAFPNLISVTPLNWTLSGIEALHAKPNFNVLMLQVDDDDATRKLHLSNYTSLEALHIQFKFRRPADLSQLEELYAFLKPSMKLEIHLFLNEWYDDAWLKMMAKCLNQVKVKHLSVTHVNRSHITSKLLLLCDSLDLGTALKLCYIDCATILKLSEHSLASTTHIELDSKNHVESLPLHHLSELKSLKFWLRPVFGPRVGEYGLPPSCRELTLCSPTFVAPMSCLTPLLKQAIAQIEKLTMRCDMSETIRIIECLNENGSKLKELSIVCFGRDVSIQSEFIKLLLVRGPQLVSIDFENISFHCQQIALMLPQCSKIKRIHMFVHCYCSPVCCFLDAFPKHILAAGFRAVAHTTRHVFELDYK